MKFEAVADLVLLSIGSFFAINAFGTEAGLAAIALTMYVKNWHEL